MENQATELTKEQREDACLQEINAALKKYDCILQTTFHQDIALGQPVLKYINQVVAK